MKQRLLTAIGLSATFFLIGCADDQARSQIAATNAQVANLQETVGVISTKVSTQKLVDILNKLDDLQNQINELNGNVDTLKQNQQDSKNSQDQLYQSLEQQIQALQKANGIPVTSAAPAATVGAATGVAASSSAAAVTDNNNVLQPGLQKIKSRNFPQAIKDFKNVINTSNNPETVASATYYLSVAYAANGQYRDSIATARKFIDDNPNNKNIPDAMRTIYISQTQLGMKKSATNTANLLIKEYPNSEAAKKVSKEINH